MEPEYYTTIFYVPIPPESEPPADDPYPGEFWYSEPYPKEVAPDQTKGCNE